MAVKRYQHEKKKLPCPRCGDGIEVSIRTQNAPLHLECAIKNSLDNARQIKEKRGPYYDRWLAGMTAKYGRPPRGTYPGGASGEDTPNS